ncbi:MAG: HlyD family efflux transporter periplasmic adaptor subunit [Aureispira sp.]|nr:HlyD family efflux transporter periplasmic adaptor subunit [Aureispira sp.]
MKKYWHLIGFILIAALLLGCEEKLEGTYPKLMPLTEGVYASGYVEAETQYKVFALASGILEEWYVTEGDTVQKGDLLLKIEGSSNALNTDNAKLALELAQSNYSSNSAIIRELELNLQNAKEKYLNDSINYQRYYRLQQQNIGTRAELDRAKLSMKTAKNSYNALAKRLKSTQQQLETEMRSARNRYKISANTTSHLMVKSELNGQVYTILKEKGELVMMQEPLAIIGKIDEFVLRLKVDELDLGKIKLGHKLVVNLDAYADQVFEAKLAKIYPLVDKQTQTVAVEAILLNPPTVLNSGLSVEANIIVNQKEEALVIPKAFLIGNDSVRTGKEKGTRIGIGLKNMEYIEVLSGLDVNTQIFKP